MTATNLQQISAQAALRTEAGDWDAARKLWQQALGLVPESAQVMLEVSYIESLAGHYRLADEWALKAARARDLSADAVLSLIRRLRTFNRLPELRRLASSLLGRPSVPHVLFVECARQLSNLNDFGPALECADAAVRERPADPAARLVRGQLLAQHARVDEAAAEFEGVLRDHPRIAIAWWMLARLRKQTKTANHATQLHALLRAPGLRPSDVAAAARALHKELDDIGDHEGAWKALEMLCRARRSTEPYDPLETRGLFDKLVSWPAGGPLREGAVPTGGKIPVFIIGMHRSGTTLVEQLLDASSQVRTLGELVDFPSAMRHACDHYCKGAIDTTIVERASGLDFATVGRRYLDTVACRLDGEGYFTDKLPANFLNIGFICMALPQARILHMVRDPVETCFSNLRELFSEVNPHSYDQVEMADYFLQYRRLMSHWHTVFPGRIHDVDYARLTSDPETTMREVAGFCGIDYVDGMRSTASSGRAVSTASSIQVREGVVRRQTPRWAPYAQHLQPLIQRLREGGALASG